MSLQNKTRKGKWQVFALLSTYDELSPGVFIAIFGAMGKNSPGAPQ